MVGLLLVAPPPGAALAATSDVPVPWLRPPVGGAVVAQFDAPAPFGPGHRGLDLAARGGQTVASPVAGRVHFAGSVAGLRWVTVSPGPRVLVTVGPLDVVGVREGDLVTAGSGLGTALGTHDGRSALHLSLRVDDRHVDPSPYLRQRPLRATLLPPYAATGPGRVPSPGVHEGQQAGRDPRPPWGRLR